MTGNIRRGIAAIAVLTWTAACSTDEVAITQPEVTDEGTRILPAVIQASLGFSTFFGGNDGDQVRDIVTDGAGNIYVVGGTRSKDFPTTTGAFDRTHNGDMDIFVAKFTAAGSLVWSTFVGGPNYDRAYAVEIAPGGDVVIAGRAGAQMPGLTGSFGPTFKGGTQVGGYGAQDGFVCKLSGDGKVVRFCGYVGTLDEHIVRDIAVDPLGNIYAVHLATKSGIPPAWTLGGYQAAFPGESTNLILKISPDGKTILGGTWFGGSGNEGGTGTIRWAGNRVYMVSTTASPNLPTPGGFDHTLGGAEDLYLAVFTDNLRSLVFATYVGGSNLERGETHNAIVDGQGNTFVGAATASTDIPGAATGFQKTNGGGDDGFVMKVSPTGSLLAATYVGGSGNDAFQGLAVTSFGRVFLSTITTSPNFPVTQFGLGTISGSSAGIVVLSFDLKSLLASRLLGGSQADEARAIALAPDGSVSLAGMTSSFNWYRVNAFQSSYGGGNLDGVIFRFTLP